jgi:hypothetical protein
MGNHLENFNAIGGAIHFSTQKNKIATIKVQSSYGSDNSILGHLFYSSGNLKNNWSIDLGSTYRQGKGDIQGTSHRLYAYFLNISKRMKKNNYIDITLFGSPYENNLRSTAISGNLYDRVKSTHNLNYGQGISARKDKYHKYFLSLKYHWEIGENIELDHMVHYTSGRGYGRLTQIDILHEGLKNVENKKLQSEINSLTNLNIELDDKIDDLHNSNILLIFL